MVTPIGNALDKLFDFQGTLTHDQAAPAEFIRATAVFVLLAQRIKLRIVLALEPYPAVQSIGPEHAVVIGRAELYDGTGNSRFGQLLANSSAKETLIFRHCTHAHIPARPWKIHDVPNGGIWIEDATGKPIVYIYHRRKDVANWKKPSHEEALALAKAIARMSKK